MKNLKIMFFMNWKFQIFKISYVFTREKKSHERWEIYNFWFRSMKSFGLHTRHFILFLNKISDVLIFDPYINNQVLGAYRFDTVNWRRFLIFTGMSILDFDWLKTPFKIESGSRLLFQRNLALQFFFCSLNYLQAPKNAWVSNIKSDDHFWRHSSEFICFIATCLFLFTFFSIMFFLWSGLYL